MSEVEVELGFLEPLAPGERPAVESSDADDWDGGKAGGRPALLVPAVTAAVAEAGVAAVGSMTHLPSAEALKCSHCGNPLLFLLQLYAPLDAGAGAPASAYHRMLYLWACAAPTCTNRPAAALPSVLALRSQAAKGFAAIAARGCALCGLPPRGRCPKCRAAEYCGTAHQAAHWRAGHKEGCALSATVAALAAGAALPEFELVVEHEPSAAERAAREAARMSPSVAKAVAAASVAALATAAPPSLAAGAGGAGAAVGLPEDLSISDLTQAKLAAWTGSHLVLDPFMQAFERRVAAEPSQVVRYCRWPASPPAAPSAPAAAADVSGHVEQDAADAEDAAEEEAEAAAGAGGPLWMTAANRPVAAGSIPPCAHCGAARAFEFQVLPQLIALLAGAPDANDAARSLDFGTLAVYTCTRSCESDNGGGGGGASLGSYLLEHVWVQPTNEEEESVALRARSAAAMRDAASAAEPTAEEAAEEA